MEKAAATAATAAARKLKIHADTQLSAEGLVAAGQTTRAATVVMTPAPTRGASRQRRGSVTSGTSNWVNKDECRPKIAGRDRGSAAVKACCNPQKRALELVEERAGTLNVHAKGSVVKPCLLPDALRVMTKE
jgi:hypothetical protein